MGGTDWGLAAAVLLAAVVEMVEALTIVLAMGMTRSWRSTLAGIAAAVLALAVFTAVAGYALATWLPPAALQLVIGALLLVFGLQWLRKAILRAAGRKAMHDEDRIFAREQEAARDAGDVGSGLDWFSFVVTFKGVFLEGVEVVFIVITFGLTAGNMRVAVYAAVAGVALVAILGAVVHQPLARVPENTLKYVVGLLLASFGTYWVVEGLGIFREGRHSLAWPGHDLAIVALLMAWFVLSRVVVVALRPGDRAVNQTRHNPRGSEREEETMPFIRGFLRFWYDFLIGDDWKIAAAVVVTLAVGIAVLLLLAPADAVFSVGLAVLLMTAFVCAVGIDVRRR